MIEKILEQLPREENITRLKKKILIEIESLLKRYRMAAA